MTSSATPDVMEALRSNTAALSRFEALPPSHKAEYLKWITSGWLIGPVSDRLDRAQRTEAKRDDTRKHRIAGMIDTLTSAPGARR